MYGHESPRLRPLCRQHQRQKPCLLCVYDEEMRENKARADAFWRRFKICAAIAYAALLLVVALT